MSVTINSPTVGVDISAIAPSINPNRLPSALAAAVASADVFPFYALELAFDSGTIRLWTGIGDKIIHGETYTGTGRLLEIGELQEVGDLSAQNLSVSLAGLDAAIISLALTENYQGRTARLLFGALNANTNTVIDAYEIFAGLMDVMTIQHSANTATISLTIESKLVSLQRPNVRRYTSANHKMRHPGDTFFDFVQPLQDKELAWGRTIAS
jgi:hypothetical protein